MFFALKLSHRGTLRATRLSTLLLALGACLPCAQAGGPHWSYDGHHAGPAEWAHLDPAFEACGIGQGQSPIDIRNAVTADLPPLEFHYPASAATLVNNGHTVQINLPAGATLKVGERVFNLLQFHFHTPSEEAINGKHAAMVAHFVHKDADGKLGVVGLMMNVSPRANPAFAGVFAHLPREGETITVEGLTLDLAALLPKGLTYYSYAGSLTTPPCSEGVSWMVLKQPVQVSAQQVAAFRALFRHNARPVQPLNGREVQVSR